MLSGGGSGGYILACTSFQRRTSTGNFVEVSPFFRKRLGRAHNPVKSFFLKFGYRYSQFPEKLFVGTWIGT